MSHNRRRLKDIENTGFGSNSSVEGSRIINADGSANLKKRGIPLWERLSVYHTLLEMGPWRFFFFILLFYTIVNLLFAAIYLFTGVEHLVGGDQAATFLDKTLQAFFFSSQTLTTVGYGRVAPSGIPTNIVASIESLVGIMILAVMTGLIYGRFSRPRAYLIFSPNLLIAPHKNGKALMFRVASYKNNHLTDVEVQITLAMHVNEEGGVVTRFYQLKPELQRINSLALSWTIVHHIDEDSPLHNISKDEVIENRMEVIINIKAFDDHFSNTVQQRTSYTYNQIIYGARFLPMFERAPDGNYTILYIDRINAHELVKFPEPAHDDVTG